MNPGNAAARRTLESTAVVVRWRDRRVQARSTREVQDGRIARPLAKKDDAAPKPGLEKGEEFG
jgi:hypothetical protein